MKEEERKRMKRTKRKKKAQKQSKPRVAPSFQLNTLGKVCTRKVRAWLGEMSQMAGLVVWTSCEFPHSLRLFCSPPLAPELPYQSSR